MKLLKQPNASTPGCWSTTPTCSLCSSKSGLQFQSLALGLHRSPQPGPGQSVSAPLPHRCRQFVEMVNGTDSEVRSLSSRSPKSQDSYPGSPSLSPRHGPGSSHMHNTGQPFFRVLWDELVWRRRAAPPTFPCGGLNRLLDWVEGKRRSGSPEGPL